MTDTAAKVAAEVVEEMESPPVEPVEQKPRFRHPGLRRMSVELEADGQTVVAMVRRKVERRLQELMPDAWQVLYEIWSIVRTPVLDDKGEEMLGDDGLPLWQIDPATGLFVEDWSRFTHAKREELLFRITTSLFRWEQIQADVWLEAMVAKSMWEEQFAIEFRENKGGRGRDTIEARTASGNVNAADDRYRAVAMAYFSRRADAIVRSLERIGQRLKDTYP